MNVQTKKDELIEAILQHVLLNKEQIRSNIAELLHEQCSSFLYHSIIRIKALCGALQHLNQNVELC